MSIVGVDVGGTFTDVVVVDGADVRIWKTPTTDDQSVAVSRALSDVEADVFLHGTTAATNTLLEARGADVSLLTDPGFEDLIEIGRQDRPSLYDSFVDRPEPLVPRERRHSSPSSIQDGEVVAVCLLDSYLDESTERELGSRVDKPVVLSADVSPEFREYERLATTVLTAYLTPSVAEYLAGLDRSLNIDTRLVMTSAGGLIPFEEAGRNAGRLALSGPAAGAVAAAAVGSHHGYDSVISFDMGGTSTDVARISGGLASAGAGHSVAGRVNRVPSIPIKTIGAGGGSVAWVDTGGALRVGPRSAGANPGPAVYGQGGQRLTVTDANVLLGNIPASLALGGTVALDLEAGFRVADQLASQLGLEVEEVIAGVIEIVDAHMERALRAVTVEEGSDPRDSVLVAFGGAGGLHASRLARRLGISKVLIPPYSGVFSALGLLMAQPRADWVQTVMLSEGDGRLGTHLENVKVGAGSRYRSMFGADADDTGLTLEVRYVGQSHELEVSASDRWDVVVDRFHVTHAERFGFRREEHVEVVNARAVATGEAPLSWSDLPAVGSREPRGSDAVWDRSSLPAGFAAEGPVVVVEDTSATLVEKGDRLTVLNDGTLEIAVDA